MKEFVSPTSVIEEEVTHDEMRIIGTDNITSIFNTKHMYGAKLTKRKHVTLKKYVMLCYCLGNQNKSMCNKKCNWVYTKGKLIVYESTNDHFDICNLTSRGTLPQELYTISVSHIDNSDINIGNFMYKNVIDLDEMDKSNLNFHIRKKMVDINLYVTSINMRTHKEIK